MTATGCEAGISDAIPDPRPEKLAVGGPKGQDD
jgi:hypothetical protein